MTAMNRLAAATALCLASFGLAACARTPASPLIAENRVYPYRAVVPACDSSAVLDTLRSRFADREANYWDSSLTIAAYGTPREIAFRPGGPHRLTFIPRRYCSVVATFSDGRKRRVAYSIGEDTGIIGRSWGINWCVDGLDRHLAHAPHCKAAGP
jgi:hypothetical protein